MTFLELSRKQRRTRFAREEPRVRLRSLHGAVVWGARRRRVTRQVFAAAAGRGDGAHCCASPRRRLPSQLLRQELRRGRRANGWQG